MLSQQRTVQLSALGERLASAWRVAGQIGDLNDREIPTDRIEACYVQDQMARYLAEPVSGWKVGATSARMRELDGHDDVIPGRIFESVTWVGTEVVLNAERFPGARAETEFAFRLSADLPLRHRPWSAKDLAPLATLHPAIEIIGNRHAIPDAAAAVRSLMTIADNGGGIGFVFGDPISHWQDIDFQNHVISLQVNDKPLAENFLGEMRCVPIQAVADLANHLSSRGIALAAGDFVSTGAATVPQPIEKGSQVIADFGALGSIKLAFE